jgi:hypothetical protein
MFQEAACPTIELLRAALDTWYWPLRTAAESCSIRAVLEAES